MSQFGVSASAAAAEVAARSAPSFVEAIALVPAARGQDRLRAWPPRIRAGPMIIEVMSEAKESIRNKLIAT